jgi:hypothetical protein
MTTADALNAVVHLADKLARDLPRSLDVAALRYAVRQLAAALAKPPTAKAPTSVPRCKQSSGWRPGYWAERKRIQRARHKNRL